MWHIEHLSIEPLLLTFSKVIDSEGDDDDDGGDDDGGDDDECEKELSSDDCEQLGQEEHSEGNEGGQTNSDEQHTDDEGNTISEANSRDEEEDENPVEKLFEKLAERYVT